MAHEECPLEGTILTSKDRKKFILPLIGANKAEQGTSEQKNYVSEWHEAVSNIHSPIRRAEVLITQAISAEKHNPIKTDSIDLWKKNLEIIKCNLCLQSVFDVARMSSMNFPDILEEVRKEEAIFHESYRETLWERQL